MKNCRFLRTGLVVAMVAVVMLSVIGGTIAWFTDTVSSENNVIQSGNLDVEVTYTDASGNEQSIESVDALFADVELWEPGAVACENLTVSNEGNLALKYQMTINTGNENTVTTNGTEYGLSGALKVAFVEGGVDGTDRDALIGGIAQWDSFSAFKLNGELLPAQQQKVGLVVYWQPTAEDNNWNVNNGKQVSDFADTNVNNLHIDLGIKVAATQLMHESDSFDNQYDADAFFGVSTVAELEAAVAQGGNVGLSENMELDGASLEIAEGNSVALNLNGQTLSSEIAKSEGPVVKNDGTLSISGGTLESTANNGGSAILNNGDLTVKDTTVNGAPREGSSWPSYAINNYGTMTLDGVTVTSYHGSVACMEGTETVITDCNLEVIGMGSSSHIFYVPGNAKLTINSGTFHHNGNVDGSVISMGNGAEVVVNGGTFSATNGGYGPGCGTGSKLTINGGTFKVGFLAWGGEVIIKGGTFSTNPTSYVAEGYQAVKNADNTWTVQPE